MNELILTDFSKAEVVSTLKQTVARGLNDQEFMLFAQLCRSTGLDPFKKEIWAIKTAQSMQLMTGINGYLAIANNHPMFDGLEVEVDDDLKPTKATCKVYRKDRKYPSVGVAMLKEYEKSTPIWKQMPRVMLTKVAKSIALREAFIQELGPLYTQEEMPPQYSIQTVVKDSDPLTSDPHELLGKEKPLEKDKLETYIIESPNSEYCGMMLCEIDPEFFPKLKDKALLDDFSARDVENMRAYYKAFVRKGYKTKAEQGEAK